ncbi:MAG TPA: PTS beta-glucoside transporter subunit EIIBCA [Clostridiales bacterium]|nr:PTS beta-glucoside transporter subunit EIIBCA [Clostridiales bacterium]
MTKAVENKKFISRFFETLGQIFKPILPIMIGGGLLQALRDILLMTGAIEPVSSSYIFLNALGDCVFYFLPIYLAFSSAKVFGASPFMAAATAGFLLYPQVTKLFEWANQIGWDLTLFGKIPVTYSKYPSSVLPIILIVLFQSKVEPLVEKFSPKVLRAILVPLVTMFVTGIVGLTIIGPIGTWIGDLMNGLITFLNERSAWIVPTLIGAFTPLLVMAGAHYSIIPIATQNLAQLGYDTVMLPGSLASNIALAGACFAVAIKTKRGQYKGVATSAGITALFGISQSALYGVAIPLKKPLIYSMIGGGIAGFIAGITQIKAYSMITPGLLSFISYVSAEASIANLIFAIVSALVAFVLTFVLTWVLGFDDLVIEESGKETAAGESQ